MKKTIDKQAEQLLAYFQNFDITDLIGFGMILGVEEKDDFIDYCSDIVVAFYQENRLKRRQLLKLAKDISVSNTFSVAAPHKDQDTPGDAQGE